MFDGEDAGADPADPAPCNGAAAPKTVPGVDGTLPEVCVGAVDGVGGTVGAVTGGAGTGGAGAGGAGAGGTGTVGTGTVGIGTVGSGGVVTGGGGGRLAAPATAAPRQTKTKIMRAAADLISIGERQKGKSGCGGRARRLISHNQARGRAENGLLRGSRSG